MYYIGEDCPCWANLPVKTWNDLTTEEIRHIVETTTSIPEAVVVTKTLLKEKNYD
jgi:hypothetical protein